MKAKSLAVTIISAAILLVGAYSGYFSPAVQAWLGIVSTALVLVLNTVFPSGTIVKGWTWVMWVTNISAIVLQLLNVVLEQGLVAANVVNAIIVGINILIQVFLKDYTGNGSIVEKKLV